MAQIIRQSILLFFCLTLLTGVVYPMAITGIAQSCWPANADGGLIEKQGQTIGSDLLGQEFDSPRYFWGRLSATAPPYNAASSSGSNLGPLNPDLIKRAKGRIDALARSGSNDKPVPIDLVTASGSGLDPDISPAAADYQVARIARARGVREEDIRALVAKHIEQRTFGLFGEPRINVLKLNIALDEMSRPK